MTEFIDLAHVKARLYDALPQFLTDLGELVSIDSGTFDRDGNNAVGRLLRERYENLGMETAVHPRDGFGDIVVARKERSGGGRILLIGHTDTVYSDGTAGERGIRREGDRLYAPGSADMKAGDLAIVYALEVLFDHGLRNFGCVEVVHNTDEEIGSPNSHDLIHARSLEADAVFVLEAGRENGDVVSARKGIADARVVVRGRAAHAGVNHARGRSAALALAHLVVSLEAINGSIPGVTVNVGRLEAGDRINVVPDLASAHLEVRAPDRPRLEEAMERIRRLADHSRVPDTEIDIELSVNHYPMHKSAGGQYLVDLAKNQAAMLGITLNDTATGGASDGNTAAAAGRPVLDGLGPVGGGAHSAAEWIDVTSIVPRVSLLVGLIAAVGRDGVPV